MMATKARQPILMGFLSSSLANGSDQEEGLLYDQNLQVNVNEVGEVAWAMAKKPYTNCYTAGRMIKAGYTRTNKYRPARWRPSRTDRRSGK
jgi:hypothetical protein